MYLVCRSLKEFIFLESIPFLLCFGYVNSVKLMQISQAGEMKMCATWRRKDVMSSAASDGEAYMCTYCDWCSSLALIDPVSGGDDRDLLFGLFD
jgi:hypothetical protein